MCNTRQIPLHRPQILPPDWDASLTQDNVKNVTISMEEQLMRDEYMDDDFYKTRVFLGINTRAIVCAAMHAFASHSVPKLTYYRGGGFNEIFSLQFPNGFRVAARIPRRNLRSPGRIESTVAMMTMARSYSKIFVPEIYAWGPDESNHVGAPYMLIEWMNGIEPWEKWFDLPSDERTKLMDELASQHAKFAKPLPFQGIGSIYFADLPESTQPSFSDISAYRLGPLCRGPACSSHRGIFSWPQTIHKSLCDFWLELWQHEVDSITSIFGSDRDTIIATEDHLSPYVNETYTLGQFLDVSQFILILIQGCDLPPDSQSTLFRSCLVNTDYAFRNIKMDPETHKITAFIDWDDIYVMPFLLCSQYPEDMCYIDGAGDRWHSTGGFLFLPLDEEDIPEDLATQADESKSKDRILETKDLGHLSISDSTSDEGSSQNGGVEDAESSQDGVDSDGNKSENSDEDFLCHDHEEYDRPRRIQDTRFRREYEQILSAHDTRFEFENFWKLREEPLKLQYLMLNGWIQWMNKEEWIIGRAKEIKP